MSKSSAGLRVFMVAVAIVLSVIAPVVVSAGGAGEEPADTERQPAGEQDALAADQGSEEVTFTVSTPPDPNIIPLAVLREKADEWGLDVNVEIVTAPAGDPSAMRAMIQKRNVHFALFNALGGTKFYNAGLDDIRLVGVHVWKGVYLAAKETVQEPGDLEGETLLAVPGMQNPPHVLSMKALGELGVGAEFVPGGSGPALMALLSQEDRAPKAFAAPEPMISIIFKNQEVNDWPVRYRVLVDPQAVLVPASGEVPLGALWLVDPAVVSDHGDAAQRFVAGFDRAVDYANDSAHYDEVAEIVADAMAEFYSQSSDASVFQAMLESGRLGLDFRPAVDVHDVVTQNLEQLYDIEVPEGVFCDQL